MEEVGRTVNNPLSRPTNSSSNVASMSLGKGVPFTVVGVVVVFGQEGKCG